MPWFITVILELLIGSLTYHPGFDTRLSERFENKVSSDGRLISNPLVGVKGTKEYDTHYRSLSVFGGQNSVGAPIVGAAGSVGRSAFRFLRLGVTVGAYHQDGKPFKDRELNSPHPFMPVVGGEVILRIPINKCVVSFNNILSPLLTNHSLSVGKYF